MEWAFGIALSTHLISGDWNEVHPSARLSFPVTESLDVGAGAFLNSEGNASAFVGLSGGDTVWWELGVATGYSGGDVIPFGRVGVEYNGTRPFVAPAYNVDTQEIGVVLGLEFIVASGVFE